VAGDPAFAADGYHLTGGSAAINRGIRSGVGTNIGGDPRHFSCIFDLGADEFLGGPICRLLYLPAISRVK